MNTNTPFLTALKNILIGDPLHAGDKEAILNHLLNVCEDERVEATMKRLGIQHFAPVAKRFETPRRPGLNMPVLPHIEYSQAAIALDTAIGEMVAHGLRIPAIKTLRAATGWGLKEAKDWLDENYPAPSFDKP